MEVAISARDHSLGLGAGFGPWVVAHKSLSPPVLNVLSASEPRSESLKSGSVSLPLSPLYVCTQEAPGAGGPRPVQQKRSSQDGINTRHDGKRGNTASRSPKIKMTEDDASRKSSVNDVALINVHNKQTHIS